MHPTATVRCFGEQFQRQVVARQHELHPFELAAQRQAFSGPRRDALREATVTRARKPAKA
jgi:hypothetical protein